MHMRVGHKDPHKGGLNKNQIGDRGERRKIRLIEGNAKCRHLKQLTCKVTLRQMFIRVYRLKIRVQ
jgi:hypothetical protein